MVLVFFANGFEESEALVTVDVLKRAGLDVKTVSVNDSVGVSSHSNLRIYTDWTKDVISPETDAELVVLPGGMPGALNLYNCEFVKRAVMHAYENGKTVAAICAAPFILGKWGLLEGRRATCYPGFEKDLAGAQYVDAKVVEDGNIVTGKGMGAVFEFAFTLVEKLCGKEKAEQIKSSICY